MFIVQRRDRLSQRPDTSRWPIFSTMTADINLSRPLKATLNTVVNLRRALTQVRPFFRVFEETVFVGLF